MLIHRDGSLPFDDEIFVFGSNLAGVHGAGAARAANVDYGAVMGIGEGIQGMSYAIPTKDKTIRTMPLDTIKEHVDKFCQFVLDNPNKRFFVTGVGCGLAGYQPKDIAPMFSCIYDKVNVSFPDTWEHTIRKTQLSIKGS